MVEEPASEAELDEPMESAVARKSALARGADQQPAVVQKPAEIQKPIVAQKPAVLNDRGARIATSPVAARPHDAASLTTSTARPPGVDDGGDRGCDEGGAWPHHRS